jgi:MoaA/NifB/PqqE/SkfB family radical SAM enzyme
MLQYKAIGLLYTRTCPLACRHCIIESSPKATGKMLPTEAEQYLQTIARFAPEVCFTGGEPMLYYNEILPLVRQATELGLLVSMVSGAGWVRVAKEPIARDRMQTLREAGLEKLCISWDEYHEEFSPRAQAALLAKLATEAGIEVSVRGVVPANRTEPREKTMFGEIRAEYQSLVQLGSAKSLPDAQFFKYHEPPRGSCNVVLSPVVEPDGNVYACCGPGRFSKGSSPLLLGNAQKESLDSIFSRSVRDPMLIALSLVGPFGLYKLLQTMPEYEKDFVQREHYNNICDVCLDMTNVPAVVASLRAKLNQRDAQAMLAAARLMQARQHHATLAATPTPGEELNHDA